MPQILAVENKERGGQTITLIQNNAKRKGDFT